jgi:origin recognition complex subunit 5
MEDNAWLWSRYTAVAYDSIGKGAARHLKPFTAVCHKLWRPFVQPIVDGTFGTRDFTKLLVSRRAIFQGEDFLTGNTMKQKKPEQGSLVQKRTGTFLSFNWCSSLTRTGNHDLPYYTKFILCAAYLASYNPSRQDKVYFMKNTERKKRKRGGNIGGRISKHRKVRADSVQPKKCKLTMLIRSQDIF